MIPQIPIEYQAGFFSDFIRKDGDYFTNLPSQVCVKQEVTKLTLFYYGYLMKKSRISPLIHRGRHIGGKAIGTMGFCTSLAVGKESSHPQWLQVTNIDLQIPNLPARFRGKRIVHLSDLHCSSVVTEKYLRKCINRVNSLDPDIVILTGDYITHDFSGRFREKAVDLVGRIRNTHGVYACLGNHDYGMGIFKRTHKHRMCGMIDGMENHGISVLRNDSTVLEIDGSQLWLVGLGDLWANDFRPEAAFKNVPDNAAVIALVHNPDGLDHLHDYSIDAVMSGHTHGVASEHGWMQLAKKRNYHAGLYDVRGKKLYVNRGLGRLGRARLNAPPEITVCTLC